VRQGQFVGSIAVLCGVLPGTAGDVAAPTYEDVVCPAKPFDGAAEEPLAKTISKQHSSQLPGIAEQAGKARSLCAQLVEDFAEDLSPGIARGPLCTVSQRGSKGLFEVKGRPSLHRRWDELDLR